MIADIEPVMIESGSLNDTDDDVIYFKGSNDSAQTGLWGGNPKVKQTTDEVVVEDNSTLDSNETYDLDADLQGFDLSDFDWTFGLLDSIPGITFLLTLEGPFEFATGFLNGTQILKTEETFTCENLISDDFITNADQIVNMTGVILQTDDIFENIYNMFDIALLVAKI